MCIRDRPGVGADRLPATDLGALAADVGRLLGRVHSIQPDVIPPPPTARQPEPWSAVRADLVAVADTVRPLLEGELRSLAGPYLRGDVPLPPPSGARRFIHNDICADHLIVDPDTGTLIGIIDWSDAIIGDPVLDFIGLIGIAGYSFIGDVLTHYPLTVDAGFGARLKMCIRDRSIKWLTLLFSLPT